MLGPTMADPPPRHVDAMGGFAPSRRLTVPTTFCWVRGDRCAQGLHGGCAVGRMSSTTSCSTSALATSVKHQVRWMKLDAVLAPQGTLRDWAYLQCRPSGWSPGVGARGARAARRRRGSALALSSVRCRGCCWPSWLHRTPASSRTARRSRTTVLLYPLRDLMGFFYWAASYASSKVLWRGQASTVSREQGRMELSWGVRQESSQPG